ncbi:MAG: DUF3662 and FHA domain-containing protein [Nostocoides sp.]
MPSPKPAKEVHPVGIFDRVEARLERAVNGVFAKAFKSEVQPVEIASAIRRAMDDRVAVMGKGRSFVPNLFTIELSSTDYDRLDGYGDDLEEELVAAAQEHADSQRYSPAGTIRVDLIEADDLETGVFRVRPQTAKKTGMTGPRPTNNDDPYAGQSPARASAVPAPVAAVPVRAAPVAPPPVAAQGRPFDVDAVDEPAQRRVHPADRPWLEIDGDRYPLMGALTIVGRDDDADIILDDPGISRRHSEIRVTSDGPRLVSSIRDLDSTNGTFVNGERISGTRLQDGDRIAVGRTSVTFRAGR